MSSRALTSVVTNIAYTSSGAIRIGENNLIVCPTLSEVYADAENCLFIDGNPGRPGRDATHGVVNVIEIGNTRHEHALVGKYDLGAMYTELRELRETVEQLRKNIESVTQLNTSLLELDRVKYIEEGRQQPVTGGW